MKWLFGLMVLPICTVIHADDKTPKGTEIKHAKVIVTGKAGLFGTLSAGGKEYSTVTIHTHIRTGLTVESSQQSADVAKLFEDAQKSAEDRIATIEKRFEAIEDSVSQARDVHGIEKILDEMVRLEQERLLLADQRGAPPTYAEGILTNKGPLDGPVVLLGRIRPYEDRPGKDRLLPLGVVVVEGDILPATKPGDKDKRPPLVIQNESCPIEIVGKLPAAEIKGSVRVTGKLAVVGGRVFVIADKVENVKKE